MFFITTLLTAYSGVVFCQQQATNGVSLSIQQVWGKAEQYNNLIQQRKLQVQVSDEEIKDAKAERLPEINTTGEYAKVSNVPLFVNGLFQRPEQLPVIHTTYTVGADVYLNIYNGSKNNIRIAEEKTTRQIREEQKNLTVSEVKLRAASYFLELKRSQIFRQLIINNIAEQEKQLEHIRQLRKNGVVLKSDVLRAELQLSRERLTLTQIENDLAIANQKLNIVIGQPDSLQIIPTDEPQADSIQVSTLNQYLADATHNAYQNKISEQETALRKLQLRDVKANVSPKVGLFANYAYSYPQIRFYPYSDVLYGLGLAGIRASFPISAFYHNKHKVKASQLEYERQLLEHEDTQDAIRQHVSEAYLRYTEAVNRVNVAQTNIQQAAESYRIINNTYFNQLALVTDLLEANNQVLQTRFDLASAQIAARLQYYQLLNITGNL